MTEKAPGNPVTLALDNVVALVERQVALRPEAIAVTSGQEVLTYAELNRRSNRLANYLRAAGVGPNAAVGLFLERSPALIVAYLAVLKAGGAYVPLDPSQPTERLAFMLKDSHASVLVTNQVWHRGSPRKACAWSA